MKTDVIIRLETPSDYSVVENMTREAFWNIYRPGCTEHYVLHKFRDRADFIADLSLVMELDGKIIGHIMYARSEVISDSGTAIPIMTFGPISVAPEYQRQGYGTVLLRYSMTKAKAMGAGALAICGSIGFYGRSGFVEGKTLGVRYYEDPSADYFLVRELEVNFFAGISGTYKDPEGYFVSDSEVERFDSHFPHKEKLKLPGQLF